MQRVPSPCPHLSCASRWWDGGGPTWYLVSLASSLYFSLGSVSTWPPGSMPDRAPCGVVEWFRLRHSLAEGHSYASVSLFVQWGWGTAGIVWSSLPQLLCAALRTLLKWDVDFSANLSAW